MSNSQDCTLYNAYHVYKEVIDIMSSFSTTFTMQRTYESM